MDITARLDLLCNSGFGPAMGLVALLKLLYAMEFLA